MIDRDLAELYGVKTFVLNQAVKRNIYRFPVDFMFRLSKEETKILKSQIVMSSLPALRADAHQGEAGKAGWGGRRTQPLAFTEKGAVGRYY